MKIIIQYFISIMILFPIIIFSLIYVIGRKRHKTHIKSFGYAADITTMILFFSVPLSIAGLWGKDFSVIVFVITLLIAIIFTYIEWKTEKEIKVLPLFKKIWRVYFIFLSTSYIIVWIFGLIHSIVEYLTY